MHKTNLLNKSICHSYYFILGMVGIGLIPPLVKRFELSYDFSHSAMGLILGIGSLLFGVSALISGALYDRYGGRRIMLFCLALSALTAIGISFSATALSFIISMFLFKLGNGFGSVINPMVAKLYDENKQKAINLLHGFHGIGKLLSPLLVAACLSITGDWKLALVIAAALYIIWFIIFIFFYKEPGSSDVKKDESNSNDNIKVKEILSGSYPLLGLFGFIIILGNEAILCSWLPNFLETEQGLTVNNALFLLTCIMLGFTFIRLIFGMKGIKADTRIIFITTIIHVISFCFIIYFKEIVIIYFAGFVLGASFGIYWPGLAATLYENITGGHGILTGLIIVASTIGAFLFSWLIGVVADLTSLKQALFMAPACAVIYAVIFYKLTKMSAKKDPA